MAKKNTDDGQEKQRDLSRLLTVRNSRGGPARERSCPASRLLRQASLVSVTLVLLCLAPGISKADTVTLDPPGQTPFMLPGTSSALSRGDFITAISNFSITSLGIEGDPALGSFTLFANVYAATGNARGPLLLSTSMTFTDSGLGFYDVPINFTFVSGVDYDINISFGSLTGAIGIFSPQYFPFDNSSNSPANFFSVGPIRVRDGEANGDAAANVLTPRLRVVTTSQVEPVPEPATMFMLGTGLAVVAATVRKRSKGQRRSVKETSPAGKKLTKLFKLAMVIGLLVMLAANDREAYASCTTGKILMKSQIPDQTFKPNMPARVTLTMRIKVFNTTDGNCGIVAMSTIPGVYIVPAYGLPSDPPDGPNVWSAIHDSVVGSDADHYSRFVVIYDGSAVAGTYGKIIISVGPDDGASVCGPGESGRCPAYPRPIMGYVNVFMESTVKEKWLTVTSTAATVSANRLILNHSYLNGNPDARIFITHTKNLNGTQTGTLHNHPISAAYDSALTRWTIQNDDLAQMPIGVSFFVRIDPSATRYTPPPFVCARNSTCCVDDGAGNCSSIRIYRPGIGNPEAAIFVTAIGTIAPNPHPISVKYQDSAWHIVNSDGTSIPRNTAFNYRIFEYSPTISGTPNETNMGGDLDDSSGVGIEVSAAGGTPSRNSSSGRALAFWWQKGDPRIPVILTANQNPGGRSTIVANPKYAGVVFQAGTPSSSVSSGPSCRIFNEDQTTLSVNASFNVWAPPQVW